MPRTVSNLRFAATADFRISDSAAQTQIAPVIAALPDGGFVAVWADMFFSTSTVRAQIFDRNGREVGSEFVVGQGPESIQPAVASLSTGGFVVSWTVGGASPNGFDIKGQVFNSSGGTVGAEFTANTTLPGFQVDSKVSGLAGGGFVITWLQPNDGTFDNVHGQVFAADGTKVGGEFLGGDALAGVKDGEDVVALAGGGFVVAWHQPNADGDRTGTRAQIFDASGNKVGAAFGLNTITTGYQQAPELAALPSGGFVAVWTDDGDTASGNPNNGNQGVWAQLFDANGAKIGDDIKVSAAGADMPDVEIIPGVGFVVVWKDFNPAPPESFGGLHAQIFDFDGNRTGEEFSINPGLQDIQNLPDVTALASGALVVGWTNWVAPQFNDEDVRARIFFPTMLGDADANVMVGTVDRDFLFGLDGDDQLSGGAEDDGLDGGGGNDTLVGGSGVDELTGGTGDDTYFVDHALDQVIEISGGGYDTVFASTSYKLAAGSEVEVLSTTNSGGNATIALTGNEFGQVITGNAGNNFLYGFGGADTLNGGAGDDIILVDGDDLVVEAVGGGNDLVAALSSYALNAGAEVETLSTTNAGGNAAIALTGNEFGQTIIGNAGANFLYGVGGADILNGGAGNDVIIVDADDLVIEAAGGGNDLVASVSNYVLAAGAEVETLSTTNGGGNATIALTGNAFGQTIIGNAGNNFLNGGGGADTLNGGAGDDIFIVDADDFVVEAIGGGNDLVAALTSYALNAGAEVETLSTTYAGGIAAINLTGNEFGQTIIGNDGANLLDGKGGNDVLIGGLGADSFAFTSALGAGNVDAISDMTAGTDKIALDDAVFTAIGGPGALNANAFVIGGAAADADDRIIYNSATGQLFYDADGSGAGAAVQFASLSTGLALTASDFLVI